MATLDQPELSRVTAPTLSTDLRLETGRVAVRGAGGAAIAPGSRWSAQGDLTGAWFVPMGRRATTEIGAALSALRYREASGAASALLMLRQHLGLGDGRGGVWAGAGGGATGRQRGRTAVISTVEAGGWLRVASLRASLLVARQRSGLDTSLFDGQVPTRGAPPLVAVDGTATVEWRPSRLELTGTATVRHAPRQSDRALWSTYATGAWWVAPRLALTASAGHLEADPVRGFPERRLTTFGARLRVGGAERGAAERRALPAAEVVARGGRRVLRVLAASSATTVEARGDFSAWRPVTLSRAGAAWELPLAADRGTVRLTLRVDGGAWTPPANVASVADDFGERSGLLVVP